MQTIYNIHLYSILRVQILIEQTKAKIEINPNRSKNSSCMCVTIKAFLVNLFIKYLFLFLIG